MENSTETHISFEAFQELLKDKIAIDTRTDIDQVLNHDKLSQIYKLLQDADNGDGRFVKSFTKFFFDLWGNKKGLGDIEGLQDTIMPKLLDNVHKQLEDFIQKREEITDMITSKIILKEIDEEKLPKNWREKLDESMMLTFSAHILQSRKGGDPYFLHPMETLKNLIAEGLYSTNAWSATLLHDVVEDCSSVFGEDFLKEYIKVNFSTDTLNLVMAVTKISELEGKTKIDDMKAILIEITKDLRVLLIKLADRKHNLESLDVFNPNKQQLIANETLDFYCPLARKFGMRRIERDLGGKAIEYIDSEDNIDFIQTNLDEKIIPNKYMTDLIEDALYKHINPYYHQIHQWIRGNFKIGRLISENLKKGLINRLGQILKDFPITMDTFKPIINNFIGSEITTKDIKDLDTNNQEYLQTRAVISIKKKQPYELIRSLLTNSQQSIEKLLKDITEEDIEKSNFKIVIVCRDEDDLNIISSKFNFIGEPLDSRDGSDVTNFRGVLGEINFRQFIHYMNSINSTNDKNIQKSKQYKLFNEQNKKIALEIVLENNKGSNEMGPLYKNYRNAPVKVSNTIKKKIEEVINKTTSPDEMIRSLRSDVLAPNQIRVTGNNEPITLPKGCTALRMASLISQHLTINFDHIIINGVKHINPNTVLENGDDVKIITIKKKAFPIPELFLFMKIGGMENTDEIQGQIANTKNEKEENKLMQMGERYFMSIINLLGYDISKITDILKDKNLHKLINHLPEETKLKANNIVRGDITKEKIFKLTALNIITANNILRLIKENNSQKRATLKDILRVFKPKQSQVDQLSFNNVTIEVIDDDKTKLLDQSSKLVAMLESFAHINGFNINNNENRLNVDLSLCSPDKEQTPCEVIEKALMLKYALNKLFPEKYKMALSPNSEIKI